MLYWLNTTYACGGVITDLNNIVIKSAPIYRKCCNKNLNDVINYLRRKNVLIDIQPCIPINSTWKKINDYFTKENLNGIRIK